MCCVVKPPTYSPLRHSILKLYEFVCYLETEHGPNNLSHIYTILRISDISMVLRIYVKIMVSVGNINQIKLREVNNTVMNY